MKNILQFVILFCAFPMSINAQSPTPFTCTDSEGFGYYTSSSSNTLNGSFLTYSSSEIGKISTASGNLVPICSEATIGVALNGLAFNPHDNFLYAVSRFDAAIYSGTLFRIGENCEKIEIPVTGDIAKFTSNNTIVVDAGGGNISSATFDLDNHYYVNTSFSNANSNGFTNQLQILEIAGNSATVLSSVTLSCPTCEGTDKLRITDIIFDEATSTLYGKNEENNNFCSINTSTGVLTEIGDTGIASPVLGMYKHSDGSIKAISGDGNIYEVNLANGSFSLLSTVTPFVSTNADAASGCYASFKITGHLLADANGMVDNTVNGVGTNILDDTPMFANLIQDGLVVKTDIISSDGVFMFLGFFSGDYEVQISSSKGIAGQVPPAQNLPNSYEWVGDNVGIDPGNDGSADGKLNFSIILGEDLEEVNFGVDGKPVTMVTNANLQYNEDGSGQVAAAILNFSDPEEPGISNVTIQSIPDPITQGILYYNDIAVTNEQNIQDFDQALLSVDPIDGDVTVSFTFFITDMAGLTSNVSEVSMPFTSSPLPVELVSFSGKHQNNVNIIEWSTAAEINSDYFTLERRSENGSFQAIGRIASAGNSSVLKKYSFTDRDVLNLAYYRLVQVDLDGRIDISKTISVIAGRSKKISLYPTISNDLIHVTMDLKNGELRKYKIVDINGQVMQTGILNSSNSQLKVRDLKNGQYFLQLLGANDEPQTIRFIKI